MIVAPTRLTVEVVSTSMLCHVLPMPYVAPLPKLASPLRVLRKFLLPLLPPIHHLRQAFHPLLRPLPLLLVDQLLPHRAAHRLVQVLPHPEARQAAPVIRQLLLQLPLLHLLLPEVSILVLPLRTAQLRVLHQVQVLLDLLPLLPVDRLVDRHRVDRLDLPVHRHPEAQAALQAPPHPQALVAPLLDLPVLLLLAPHLPVQAVHLLLRLREAQPHRHQVLLLLLPVSLQVDPLRLLQRHTQPFQCSQLIVT